MKISKCILKGVAVLLALCVLSVLQVSAAEAQSTTVKWYTAGSYKVGTDMPAGQYYVESTESYGCYYSASSDSSGSLKSIITNGNVDTFTFVTLETGDYFEIKRGKATLASNIPAITTRGEGTYRVGVDIPAGEYKLESTSTYSAYVAVLSGTRGSVRDIVSNDNFEGSKYISATEGQYLQVKRAKITQQPKADTTPKTESSTPDTKIDGGLDLGAGSSAGSNSGTSSKTADGSLDFSPAPRGESSTTGENVPSLDLNPNNERPAAPKEPSIFD